MYGKKLKKGGFGTVYKVEDNLKYYAIKKINLSGKNLFYFELCIFCIYLNRCWKYGSNIVQTYERNKIFGEIRY